ncbi:hypothetical protein RRG08_019083 [Elysia crispata]|uniref:Uncharacterized protein n=1 Tax=Elysia crispata TaxID=231223 RepID=A0AAE1A5Q9_9GAST|nr:hypothetical protein RRG08_019083 [Elysia crispata]
MPQSWERLASIPSECWGDDRPVCHFNIPSECWGDDRPVCHFNIPSECWGDDRPVCHFNIPSECWGDDRPVCHFNIPSECWGDDRPVCHFNIPSECWGDDRPVCHFNIPSECWGDDRPVCHFNIPSECWGDDRPVCHFNIPSEYWGDDRPVCHFNIPSEYWGDDRPVCHFNIPSEYWGDDRPVCHFNIPSECWGDDRPVCHFNIPSEYWGDDRPVCHFKQKSDEDFFFYTKRNILASACGQLHPDDEGVTCFRCDDTTRDNFPLCLQHPVKCAAGQVCQIRYGPSTERHIPHMFCKTRATCEHGLRGHPLPCEEGGYHVDRGVCQECCESSVCVANLTNYVRLDLVSSKNMFCPGRCHLNDIKACMHNGRVCNENTFCQVKIDRADLLSGACLDDHLYPTCQRSLSAHPCPNDFKNSSAYDSTNNRHCFHDCCATNECLFAHFGIHMAHAVSPTTLPVSSSVENSTGLWQQLRGSCEDTFDLALCQSLKTDHAVCLDRESVSMCPRTCGICTAVDSYVCKDTSDLCGTLSMSQTGFCDTEEGTVQCPTICGKCDQLLESVILSVLSGTATAAPAMTTLPPVDCSSIQPEDCVHFGPLCLTAFLGVICPDQCAMCSSGEGSSA